MEGLKQELTAARTDYIKLLESSLHITSKLLQGVEELQLKLETQTKNCAELGKELKDKELVGGQLQPQIATERAGREEIETQLSPLYQNYIPTAALSTNLTPDGPTILSKLRAKHKKSKVDLADIEAILELLES